MSSKPESRTTRRSLRKLNRPEITDNEGENQESSLRTRKRKNDSQSDAGDIARSPELEETLNTDSPVGQKTSREKLLHLLARHVKPRKKRKTAKTPKNSQSKKPPQSSNAEKSTSVTITSSNTSGQNQDTIDYSIFHESQLIEMLKNVGMDTRGLNKEALVASCKIYEDLIIIPEFSVSFPRVVSSTSETQVGTSSKDLPSLEHGRFDFPRPTPTSPFFTRPSGEKGKGKALEDVDNDWIPPSDRELSATLEEVSELDNPIPETNTRKERGKHSARQGGTSKNQHTTQQSPCSDLPASDQADSIASLKSLLLETQERVEALESELQTLSSLVKKWFTERDRSKKGDATCGGRIAARLRFHVETLLGTGNDKPLPRPASLQDHGAWKADMSLDEVDFNIDLDQLPSDPDEQDHRFPYKDGPGHSNATPQQLSIMWQMLKTVGVTSFRPDFSQAASSKSNKWLWELALKIFVKLVECGEYTGIPLGSQGIKVIRKNLKSHIQTLMKRYRQENWDAERKKKAADEVRRATRMRHLKTLRERIVLSRDCMWPLSRIINAACSDDETADEDDTAAGDPLRYTRPCRVRILKWRSSDLELVCSRIDDYKSRVDSSIPGVSPGQRGRRPRERIRSQDGPVSKIKPPTGLPVDCYSETWLNGLSPLDRNELEIIPTPMLKSMLTKFDTFM